MLDPESRLAAMPGLRKIPARRQPSPKRTEKQRYVEDLIPAYLGGR